MAEDLIEKLLINGEDQEEKERNTIIVEKEERLGDKILNENKKLWVVAAPAIFTRFSTFGVNVISLAFIGHIGATELAAYALVSTVLLRFCIGIIETTHTTLYFTGRKAPNWQYCGRSEFASTTDFSKGKSP
ncbi:hypothetical protein RND71_023477 [Anisodus tanguticus]|uniref:Uncharacterized protein n=1 Tax=Anisodus tanguticus TaxID=243964 RepID=A0AAE1RUX5_9SOLA|nr:hypothetical protein RND71_023477 [Anisodus tanguticus]